MFACKIDFILKDDGESVWISSPIVNVYREINELNLTKSYLQELMKRICCFEIVLCKFEVLARKSKK